MENFKEVFVPNEMRFRTEEISRYSKPELAAHLYVANLLGDEGRRINTFTVRNMRVEAGKCVMTCLKQDGGKWGEIDVESLEHAHCDAELINAQAENEYSDEAARENSMQMEVSVPLHILREIEERCKVEIEMISQDVFKQTGRILKDVDDNEKRKKAEEKQGGESNVRELRRGVRADMRKLRMAA